MATNVTDVVESDPLAIETAKGSIMHGASARWLINPRTGRLSIARLYLLSTGATYGVLLVCAFLELPSLLRRSETLRLPFLLDSNVMYMFLISFPVLVFYLLTDEGLLRSALRQIRETGVLSIAPDKAHALVERWEKRYRAVNTFGQIAGVVVAVGVGFGNYAAYGKPSVGYWILVDGRIGVSAWMYFTTVGLFYFVASFYLLRSVTTIFFLYDLVSVSVLRILPFHPDNSGGLRPIGRIALRNQYALTVLGINVFILIWVVITYLPLQPGIAALILAAVGAYVLFGPVVFVVPLLPFRRGMLLARAEMLHLVAREADVEVRRLRTALENHALKDYDTNSVEKLQRIGVLISQLPVWPFDTTTLRKFVAAYVIPIAGFGIALILEITLQALIGRLK